jgi:Fe-S oxidoreductase
MWMEEKIGTRINLTRTDEALAALDGHASPDGAAADGHTDGQGAIATGCPFCRVMLSDGLTARQADGQASESVEVLDVAQLLLESVRRA